MKLGFNTHLIVLFFEKKITMNKISSLFFFILFSNCISSQSLNLSFEDLDESGSPKSWLPLSYPKNSTITSDSHHGKNAVRINNYYGYVAGSLYLGDINQKVIVTDIVGEQGSLGMPIQQKVLSLKGWYKYEQVDPNRLGKDSGQVIIILRRFLELEQKSVVIGQGLLNLGAKDQYTEFQVPIKYLRDLLPDTMSIFFSTTYDRHKLKPSGGIELLFSQNSQQCNTLGQTCFYLTIDDLSLQFTTPTKNPRINLQLLQISPNPTDDKTVITWELPTPSRNVELSITDVLGRTLQRVQTDQNQVEVNTIDLPKGMYVVYLRQAGQLLGTERLLIAK
ncbi:T9SS type A sorting domain-containing protein [Haliscomenobacter sp.]|uniref:T9SS type A sorting domain-containing protein n=1 Tax=Haliscomenobacter sp. TaxID=2717303 RepID=UPI0035948473